MTGHVTATGGGVVQKNPLPFSPINTSVFSLDMKTKVVPWINIDSDRDIDSESDRDKRQ